MNQGPTWRTVYFGLPLSVFTQNSNLRSQCDGLSNYVSFSITLSMDPGKNGLVALIQLAIVIGIPILFQDKAQFLYNAMLHIRGEILKIFNPYYRSTAGPVPPAFCWSCFLDKYWTMLHEFFRFLVIFVPVRNLYWKETLSRARRQRWIHDRWRFH